MCIAFNFKLVVGMGALNLDPDFHKVNQFPKVINEGYSYSVKLILS